MGSVFSSGLADSSIIAGSSTADLGDFRATTVVDAFFFVFLFRDAAALTGFEFCDLALAVFLERLFLV